MRRMLACAVAAAAFAGSIGLEPEAADLDDGGYAWVDVLAVIPEKQKPFEEVTAERLGVLANTRQVIVFTHRLSFVSLLESAAENVGIKRAIVTLRHEPWGAGEPDKSGRAGRPLRLPARPVAGRRSSIPGF